VGEFDSGFRFVQMQIAVVVILLCIGAFALGAWLW